MITAVTYGLSLVNHPNWKYGRPEIMLTINSNNISWGQVVGYIANKLRGDCPFSYGNTINFEQNISDDSDMDAFFIFAPTALEEKQFHNIDIGLKYNITIAGIYPIYLPEMKLINNVGLEKFWKHPGFDLYNPKRISLAN